jgi:thioredoxin 1
MPARYQKEAAQASGDLATAESLCYLRGTLRGAEGAGSMSAVQEVTDTNFENEVINSDLPVLIDFWAPWCAPCRAIGPVVDELSRDYSGKLKVVKMNVDDNPLTPSRFGVRSIPNLLIFKNGQVKDQIVGAVPKQVFEQAIRKVV